ncbi:MAG: hypothetical protein ACLR76_08880 [Alistipes sp.]
MSLSRLRERLSGALVAALYDQRSGGSRSDKQTAERKIASSSKLNDSTFSIYADTSRRFNQLLSFESEFAGNRYESLNAKTGNIALLPMFKFSLMTADTLPRPNLPGQYYVEQSEQFLRDVGDRGLRWVATAICPPTRCS